MTNFTVVNVSLDVTTRKLTYPANAVVCQGEENATMILFTVPNNYFDYDWAYEYALNDNPPVLRPPVTQTEIHQLQIMLDSEMLAESGRLEICFVASYTDTEGTHQVLKSLPMSIPVPSTLMGEVAESEANPSFLSTVIESAANAKASEEAAAVSEINASASETNAGISAGMAGNYATEAQGYKNQAATSETNAAQSEQNAAGYAATMEAAIGTHNTSETAHNTKFAGKADKVDGKLPMEQLPALTLDDIGDGTIRTLANFVAKIAGSSLIEDTEKTRLAAITAEYIAGLISSHNNASNAHSALIGLRLALTTTNKDNIVAAINELVTTIAGLTTASINDSVDKRYVTDDQRTTLQNTSGTNTGDETKSTITEKVGVADGENPDAALLAQSDFNWFKGKAEKQTITTVADVSNTFTCDLANQENFKAEVTNTTAKALVFSNVPTGLLTCVYLELICTAVAAITYTLNGGTVTWKDGSVPAYEAGKKYKLIFISSDNGATWQAAPIGAWA